MNLLECLVGIAVCLLLVSPLLKVSSEMLVKQVQLEQSQLMMAEADRALELMGRAIRMAGYQNSQTSMLHRPIRRKHSAKEVLEIRKDIGLNRSDALYVKQEVSDAADFDCIGNVITKERTKNGLAHQGFFLERSNNASKGSGVRGGSLMCQSLDRQGRLQNSTLIQDVWGMKIEEIPARGAQKLIKVTLQMRLGNTSPVFSRTFSTRNLP